MNILKTIFLFFRKLFHAVMRFIFPICCPFCEKPLSELHPGYCQDCYKKLWRLNEKTCTICGMRFSNPQMPSPICADCRGHRFPYVSITAPVSYNHPVVRKAVLDYKFHSAIGNFRPFAAMMILAVNQQFSGISFDYITYVPSRLERMRQRGFCPPEFLAEEIARHFGVPYIRFLRKIRKTKHQSTLSTQERRVNLKDAFICINADKMKGKTILLVDDVVTTGASLKECSKTLRRAGAARVYCIAFARTEKPRGDFNAADWLTYDV